MTGKYQVYPEYKDSKVDWLGKVPSHWNVSGFKKYLYSIIDYRGKTPNKADDGILLVTARNIKNGKLNYLLSQEFVSEDDYEDVMSRGKPNIGDVLFTTEAPLGEVANVDDTNIALAQRIIKFCGKNDYLDNYYFKYFIMSEEFQQSLNLYASGSTAKGIKAERFVYLRKLLPPLNEQKYIAAFLNHETAKIDRLIEKQQQLIALLKEKRQAVISHAVTKGLDPNVKMKDSGVELLGEVPEHWGIRKLRYVGRCQNGINIGAEYFGTGYPFVSYSDVYNNSVLPMTVAGLVQSSKNDREAYSVKSGDVFFTRTSETIDEIGFSSACLKTIEKATFAGFLIRFRPEKDLLDSGFSKYYFGNVLLRDFFTKEMNLVTRASLSQDLLKKLPVLLPSLKEQKQIAEFLDKKISIFSKLIDQSMLAINFMQERRSALISAAATGKIDVRNWQADKPSAA